MATLDTPVKFRYVLTERGVIVKRKRDPYSTYGCPSQAPAFFWYEQRGRYIVAVRAETRTIRYRRYGCYHVLPTHSAAIMFALAAGGE